MNNYNVFVCGRLGDACSNTTGVQRTGSDTSDSVFLSLSIKNRYLKIFNKIKGRKSSQTAVDDVTIAAVVVDEEVEEDYAQEAGRQAMSRGEQLPVEDMQQVSQQQSSSQYDEVIGRSMLTSSSEYGVEGSIEERCLLLASKEACETQSLRLESATSYDNTSNSSTGIETL